MLIKLCAKCGNITALGEPYCTSCKAKTAEEKEKNRQKWKQKADQRYNQKRNPKFKEFYNSKDWRALRSMCLMEAGYCCEKCKEDGVRTLAVDVHHILPIDTVAGWDARLNPNNIIALCLHHHNEAHGRFGGGTQKSMKDFRKNDCHGE